MKLSWLLMTVCLFLSLPAMGADSRADVFGGFQYARLDGADLNGWNAALTGHFTEHLGVTADFSGVYQTVGNFRTKTLTYTFGPVISGNTDSPFVPFAHALFGGVHTSGELSNLQASFSGFAMILGGGVDFSLTNRISIRAGQFDWMSLHESGGSSNNNFRYSGGVVFHF